METPLNSIDSLFEKIEAYSKTTYELSVLKALDIAIEVITSLIARLSVVIMIFFFAIILSIGIALLIGDWLGKVYYGFFIVAGFYLFAIITMQNYIYMRIKKPICDLIISKMFQ